MSNSSGAIGRQRDLDDQARDREVYRYLLTLSGLPLSKKDPPTPNETRIAEQWGFAHNRIFVRRVLRSVLYEAFYQDKEPEPPPVPGLTLSKLVGILSALQDYQQREQSLNEDSRASHIITHQEKLKVLGLFFQLSAEERAQLSIRLHRDNALLNQIVEKIADPVGAYTSENMRRLYQFFLKQLSERSDESFSDAIAAADDATPQEFIRRIVSQYANRRLVGLKVHERNEVEKQFVEKVEREINRIELQSGLDQVNRYRLRDADTQGYEHLRYFTADFIRRLVHSVIDNELITDEFPVHLKYFEIKRIKPLPLFIQRAHQSKGLLNPFLLGDEQEVKSVEGLERQVAYRVRVHFYINLPEDYEIQFKQLMVQTQVTDHRRLEFSEDVVGIGSPSSHILTAINRVLIWDIPLLNEYAPIVDGVYCNDDVMGGTPNSPVWSHATARLYKLQEIEAAIASGQSCDEVATRAETASADFCGFDVIETAAKAALIARLKLIKQVLASRPGVSAKQYISELCYRVEEATALRQSKEAIQYYPFSLRAMEGQLEETVFKQRYRERSPQFIFKPQKQGDYWSVVAIEAQIAIAEANLKEGLTHIGRKYLEAVQPYFEGKIQSRISNLLLAKYHLCWFRYEYLSDLDDAIYPQPDRYVAIRQAEAHIAKAEAHLRERIDAYEKTDELPQANLHPQFYLLSRVYAHRAKLYIFFSKYMPRLEQGETLLRPIQQLEKARIYAAQDGDPTLYAQWSAYQSWCYLMLAYLGDFESDALSGFSESGCIGWARRLIAHANVCYSANGKVCYQQIKDAGGRTTPYVSTNSANGKSSTRKSSTRKRYYEKYGSTMVEVMPLIQELLQTNEQVGEQSYDEVANLIKLDISILKKSRQDKDSSLYLFGMQSSILLFAQGMLALCQDYDTELLLLEAIESTAMRLFTYCWAIASDGTRRNEDPATWPEDIAPNSIVLDREVSTAYADGEAPTGDRLLQCLYPHRLTQFADLGKIFAIACELILLQAGHQLQTDHQQIKQSDRAAKIAKIRQLVKELRQNNRFPFPKAEACGQTRYNAHLAEHYVQLETYVEKAVAQLQSKSPQQSGMQVRKRVVADIFRIVRGEINVSP